VTVPDAATEQAEVGRLVFHLFGAFADVWREYGLQPWRSQTAARQVRTPAGGADLACPSAALVK